MPGRQLRVPFYDKDECLECLGSARIEEPIRRPTVDVGMVLLGCRGIVWAKQLATRNSDDKRGYILGPWRTSSKRGWLHFWEVDRVPWLQGHADLPPVKISKTQRSLSPGLTL
jgi:hypothetical protein